MNVDQASLVGPEHVVDLIEASPDRPVRVMSAIGRDAGHLGSREEKGVDDKPQPLVEGQSFKHPELGDKDKLRQARLFLYLTSRALFQILAGLHTALG